MTLRRKFRGYSQWFLSYDIKSKTKGKKQINKTSTKFKTLCVKRYYQESEKTTHKMGEYLQIIHLLRI